MADTSSAVVIRTVRAMFDDITDYDRPVLWLHVDGRVTGLDHNCDEFELEPEDVQAIVQATAASRATFTYSVDVADLQRQLEQARSVAVQLEQQVAAVLGPLAGLVVADDGRVWWVSPDTGAAVELDARALGIHLAQVVRAAEEVAGG